MDIDLGALHRGDVDSIKLEGVYTLPEEYYKDTEILHLSDLKIEGIIEQKENEEIELQDYCVCTIEGKMVIHDSVSWEEVDYPFSISYDDFLPENCIKNENLLDIFAFLWENTVLEVPLQFTKVSDLSKFHGDGWRLIREEERNLESNPFRDLLKDFEEE